MKNMKKRIAIVTKHTGIRLPANPENGSFEHRPRLIPAVCKNNSPIVWKYESLVLYLQKISVTSAIKINYVVPSYGIRGPGPQRIVVGADGSWYYTPDHYDTFIRFKP